MRLFCSLSQVTKLVCYFYMTYLFHHSYFKPDLSFYNSTDGTNTLCSATLLHGFSPHSDLDLTLHCDLHPLGVTLSAHLI